ncbi:hypothetical protein ILYODFUR_037027 [Ilyodon furcidens]|uniref:Uncharacterized protein n=1 Tax=Ilyodon furcidens TaxID=33524 RepID=A0ABV0TPY8_9TELE
MTLSQENDSFSAVESTVNLLDDGLNPVIYFTASRTVLNFPGQIKSFKKTMSLSMILTITTNLASSLILFLMSARCRPTSQFLRNILSPSERIRASAFTN